MFWVENMEIREWFTKHNDKYNGRNDLKTPSGSIIKIMVLCTHSEKMYHEGLVYKKYRELS